MPYNNQYADKSSHVDIVQNPEVAEFIGNCSYMLEPTEQEEEQLKEMFVEIPESDIPLPEHVISVDGSSYEASINNMFPSTKLGYIKIGCLLIDRSQYKNLRVHNNRFVDPFRVAKMQDSNRANTFSLPSSNLVYKGSKSVQASFRYALDEQLYRLRTIENEPSSSMRTTLFHMAAIRTGELGTNDPNVLKLHKCPSCGVSEVEVFDIPDEQKCPHCGEPVYPTDCLRIWEEVSEYLSNTAPITRLMNVIEHLIPVHYIRIIREFEQSYFANILDNLAFFVDGPLAVFGTPAWLHASILRYINKINNELITLGKHRMVIIGLQKSGAVVDYFSMIDRLIPSGKIFAVKDEFRYKYITPCNTPSNNGFGYETYYGQDFVLKTESGRTFVLSIPYPFPGKASHGTFNFVQEKVKLSNYPELGVAVSLIRDFECDLYENAVVPIALAHKYTAISLEPGSKVLDLLSREHFRGR